MVNSMRTSHLPSRHTFLHPISPSAIRSVSRIYQQDEMQTTNNSGTYPEMIADVRHLQSFLSGSDHLIITAVFAGSAPHLYLVSVPDIQPLSS